MEATKKWRFRFGLRGLLVGVAVCAVVALLSSWLPNSITTSELRDVSIGMTKDEVRTLLGEPIDIHPIDEPRPPYNSDEAWSYVQWDYLDAPPAVGFRNGRVIHVRGR